MAKHAFLKLLNATIEEESMMDVINILGRYFEHYCEFSDLRARSAGRKIFVEVRLVLPEQMPLAHRHVIAVNMEKDIAQNVPGVEVTIKTAPCRRNCEYVKRNEPCP